MFSVVLVSRTLAAVRPAIIQWTRASTRGLASAVAAPPMQTLRVLAKRFEDADFFEVEIDTGMSVSFLKSVLINKLRINALPNAVTLAREDSSTPLDSTLSVSEMVATGKLAPHVKLLLVVHAPALPADEIDEITASYRLLYEALLDASVEPIKDSVGAQSGSKLVQLPAWCNAEWPQLGPDAPLFVRSFYEGCFEGVLASFDANRTRGTPRKFTIVGNAGIGKSAFGAYLLWRAVQARRTVIYVSDKVDVAFVMHSDGRVETCNKDDFNFNRCTTITRSKASTVLICDGIKPPICNAFTVLITSPVRERWKEFDKCVDARRLFFPVFSLREINDMRRSCFPQLSCSEAEAGVHERYKKWGGIPRYVLAKTDMNSQELLDSAVTKVNINEIFNKLGARELESDIGTSHRLVHLKPVGEAADGTFTNPGELVSYMITRSELGSPYIKRAVFEALDDQELQRLDALPTRVPTSPAAARLYDDLFEHAALHRRNNLLGAAWDTL